MLERYKRLATVSPYQFELEKKRDFMGPDFNQSMEASADDFVVLIK